MPSKSRTAGAVTVYFKDRNSVTKAKRMGLNVSRICELALELEIQRIEEERDLIHDLVWGKLHAQ